MTDEQRLASEARQIIAQAALLVVSALSVGAFAAWALIVPACSSPHGTHPAQAPPATLTAPLLPQPTALQTVPGPTAYTAAWVDALRCWGAEDYYPEPVVRVVPCDLRGSDGEPGFVCEGIPCHGCISGGAVLVCRDAGIAHEFAHAALYSLTGDFGVNCEDAPAGSRCCAGVAR